MPRLFIEGNRFEAVGSNALREREYQALILQYAESLFPGLITVPFSRIVYHEGIGHGADLAVIAPDYSQWWVIEVELAHHSLEGHVLPQVSTLAQAPYGRDEARWLHERNSQLDLVSLERMMLGSQPEVVVVVNAARPSWAANLRPWARLMIVELFRSDRDRYILRQNGADLAASGAEITRLHMNRTVPRMLVVESPAPLLDRDEDVLEIEYEGEVTDWIVIEAADGVWLSPRRSGPFPASPHLELVALPGDRLGFVPIDPPPRTPPP